MKILYYILSIFISLQMAAQVSLSSGLAACYSLNGNITDGANNLNGTLNTATPTADRNGNANAAYALNGSAASYISLPNDPLLKTGEVSFSGWVKFENISPLQFIVFTHNGCGAYQEGYQLSLNRNGGNPCFQIAKASAGCSIGGQQLLSGSFMPAANAWYHVGFYAGPDSLKLYVNGSLDAAGAKPGMLAYSSTAGVYLGGSTLGFNYPMKGSLDNIRFYNRKLNNAEMAQLYSQDPACVTKTITPPTPTTTPTQTTTVGVAERAGNGIFSVFPNPVAGIFTLKFSEPGSGELLVVNTLSQEIHRQYFAGEDQIKIDLQGQPAGIYFVQINMGGQKIIKKIIRE